MILKKTKIVKKLKFIRTKRNKYNRHYCYTLCKRRLTSCVGSSFCGEYIFHKEFNSRQLKSLKYCYFIENDTEKSNNNK